MGLTKDEFFQAWIDAKESQEPYIIETAWKRYEQTQQPDYKSTSKSNGPTAEQFQASLDPFLSDANVAGHIEKSKFISIPADVAPWRATGLVLEHGQKVSVFNTGRVWRSKLLDLSLGPQWVIWYRVGVNGKCWNSTQDTETFEVGTDDARQEFFIANMFPGAPQTETGRAFEPAAYHGARGRFESLIVVWKSKTDVSGLLDQALQSRASSLDDTAKALLRTERKRPGLEQDANIPPDWHYFWFIGNSSLYSFPPPQNGRQCIHCKPYDNVGILQKELLPLVEFKKGTTAQWDWKIDALPSRLREDTTFSHDYLSVAFEFENGRDITYTWSWELPEEYGYWCPLPSWTDREYHVVIRSGTRDLGQWLSEKRDLYADYQKYMYEKDVPERITRVWLIAGNLLQKNPGEMSVRGIEILDGEGHVTAKIV